MHTKTGASLETPAGRNPHLTNAQLLNSAREERRSRPERTCRRREPKPRFGFIADHKVSPPEAAGELSCHDHNWLEQVV
jgi:hypothetical protein